MRRTTSLSEITFDVNPNFNDDVTRPDRSQSTGNNANPQRLVVMAPPPPTAAAGVGGHQRQPGVSNIVDGNQNWLLSTVSPRNHRRNFSDFLETPHFLRVCSLCKLRLVPGRDIYMYRGDSAFCSLECRQQQMNQDERKEKCSLTSKNQVPVPPATAQVAAKGETVVAL